MLKAHRSFCRFEYRSASIYMDVPSCTDQLMTCVSTPLHQVHQLIKITDGVLPGQLYMPYIVHS